MNMSSGKSIGRSNRLASRLRITGVGEDADPVPIY
jgi:hypothetical protein